mmetsp:Transcript_22214/g.34193  ORF Transcript_22214/g.34193 Transcript_22214/m.34193 type:complete len:543 (+) Transcript_22214:39-1667(+)
MSTTTAEASATLLREWSYPRDAIAPEALPETVESVPPVAPAVIVNEEESSPTKFFSQPYSYPVASFVNNLVRQASHTIDHFHSSVSELAACPNQEQQQQQQQRVGGGGPSSINSRPGNPQLNHHQQQRDAQTQNSSVFGEQPLIEIPEEIYAVRKSALRVLKPLIKTWLIVALGFSLSALFGMVRWTQLVLDLPYWFVLLPSWASHVGLLWCHISSAKALSRFIAEANDNRQRPDSMDHLDRTEYLPLLQRSLKFGLKTGIVSFFIFVFEVLVYIRLAKGSISLGVTLIPVWIFVVGGLLHGLVCKTQHPLKLLCWVLALASLILATMRVDYGVEEVQWRFIISPLVAVLSISSGTLIYIVYGHQIGYYRLTEAQLTAGILYSMAALLSVILLVVVIEVTPLARPVEIQTRFFVVVLAPLIVCLVGMGAWAISRDEFAKLLLYGGQAAVHPRKLRLETKGWTSVESKGVATIPMFGEVRFKPLEHNSGNIELCTCSFCACYPYEEDEEEPIEYPENATRLDNIYLAPSASQTTDRSRMHDVA